MGRYRLTLAAEEDFALILEQGILEYGFDAGIRYHVKLEQRFETIVERPKSYQSVEHILKNYRRSVCGVHSIYFRVDAEEIVTVRILKKQDPLRQLKG